MTDEEVELSGREKARQDLLSETEKFAGGIKESVSGNRLAETFRKWGHYKYGFDIALETGIYSPFPHEVDRYVTCFSSAVLYYFIACHTRTLRPINPRFFIAHDLTSAEGDHNVGNSVMEASHAFIDLDISARKGRVIVDRFLGTFGTVKYDLEARTLSIAKTRKTSHTKLGFSRLEELTYDELVDRLMYLRTPKGSIATLANVQKTKTRHFARKMNSIYIQFHKDDRSIGITTNIDNALVANSGIEKKYYFDSNGDIARESLVFFTYAEGNTWTYKGKADLGEFSTVCLDPLLGVIKDVLRTKDSNLGRHRLKRTPLFIDYLEEHGVSVVDRNLEALPTGIGQTRVEHALDAFDGIAKIEYDKLQTRTDEASQALKRALLVRELYRLTLAERKQKGEDDNGYLFTQNERDEKLEKDIDQYYEKQARHQQDKKQAIRNYCRLGSGGLSDFGFYLRSNALSTEYGKLDFLAKTKRFRPREYNQNLDLILFVDSLGDASMDELQQRVVENSGDSFNAYREMVFKYVVMSYQARTVLKNRDYLYGKLVEDEEKGTKERNGGLIRKVKEYLTQIRVERKIEQLRSKDTIFTEKMERALDASLYDPNTVGKKLSVIEDTINDLLAA